MHQVETSVRHKVLWLQVWALAGIQGAFILSWVIYNLYLVDLLGEFDFPKPLAVGILMVENALGAVMEPLMGSFSDRFQHWVGSRLPIIAFGMILASSCSIAIPAILVFGNSQGVMRWILPTALLSWALAMTVFRSPALSLLGRYAFATNLPQAASILTLVGAVAGAMAPLASEFILGLGKEFAFAIGSFVLLGAAAALRFANPDRLISSSDTSKTDRNSRGKISIACLSLIFGAGVGVTLGFRLLMQNFPKIIKLQVPGANTGIILGCIFIALAITAIPSGLLARRLGNRRSMLLGLGLMAVFCGSIALTGNSITAVGIAIFLGASYSLVSNGTIPFALSLVPSEKGGLGTGMFFSGGAVASSFFFGVILSSPEGIAPQFGAILGALAFIFAAACVTFSARIGSYN
ncbi:MAG: MFS transporter [Prochloraceae cyanobacterium]|nr:MFS transporter [Prochloraceae cyanobacterium]